MSDPTTYDVTVGDRNHGQVRTRDGVWKVSWDPSSMAWDLELDFADDDLEFRIYEDEFPELIALLALTRSLTNDTMPSTPQKDMT